jgi:acetyl-CoA acyltransferase
MQNVVIAGYARSPFHFASKGQLARVRGDDLAAQVVRGLVERTGVDPADIEDLIVGCAFPEGEQGMNVARLIGLLAELPLSVGGATVNRFCGSSMQSVHMAAGQIALGAGEVFIAAGVESMSRVPMGGYNPMPNAALAARSAAYMGMGETAENVARQYEISRAMQEQFAVESQRKAGAAQSGGRLSDEIVPITTKAGVIDKDGCLRPETTAEGLAGLKLAFDQNGTVTAGTASPLTDGASAVLVCSEEYAARKGLKPLARILGVAISGCQPETMGLGPIQSSRKALKRAGIEASALDVVELNEAFASQALACIRDLGLRPETVNLDGGRYGLATQCIGGGQGIATVLERI